MLILPTAMPVQAEEVENTNKNVTVTSDTKTYNYKYQAKITANDVCLRRTPGKSGEVMLLLKKGATLYVSDAQILKDEILWRPCKYTSGGKTYYGFVASQYVHIILP